MYPEPRVTDLIVSAFVPVRAHIKEQAGVFGRFGAWWTPTVIMLDPNGRERYRIDGFLTVEHFLGQLELGAGLTAVGVKDWAKAEQHFKNARETYGDTDAGPPGMYWEGVAKYSGSHDHNVLVELALAFEKRYPESSWAIRASVWKPKERSRAVA